MKLSVYACSAIVLALWGTSAAEAADKFGEKECPAPAAFVLAKTQHVFFRDAGGDIWEMYNKQGDAKGWQRKNLTAAAKAVKAASNPAAFCLKDDKSEHVLFRSADGQIHELYFSMAQGKWQTANLSAQTKGPKAAGDPSAFANEDVNTQHVVFRTAEGNICELYRVTKGDNRGWHMKDLTAESRAPRAAGDPAAYYLGAEKSQHVVFRGTDDNLYELSFSQAQGKWQSANLTALTKAPRPAGDPAGYVQENNKTQHVIFRTTDGDICEMFRKSDGDDRLWHCVNLTAEAKAPKAASDPTGYVLKADKALSPERTQHVVYRDNDGNIHEVYYSQDQGKWLHSDLSSQTKAPKAIGEPAAYVLDDNRTQHVIFQTAEGKIYELYNKPDGPDKGWRANDLSAVAEAP